MREQFVYLEYKHAVTVSPRPYVNFFILFFQTPAFSRLNETP